LLEAVGLLLLQHHDAVEPRPELVEVRSAARLRPDLLGLALRRRELRDELGRQFRGTVVVAAQPAHVGCAVAVLLHVGIGLGGGEPFTNAWIRGSLVLQPGEQGKLLGADVSCPLGHADLLVPSQ
jgi:hypothetical protein